MTMTQVNTGADFPNIAILRRQGPEGEVWILAFRHKEFGGWKQRVFALAGLLVLVALPLAMVYLGLFADALGVHWLWGVGLAVGIFAFFMLRLNHPFKEHRAIELDFGRDELRVLKGKSGKVKIRRQLSRLTNLTVEDHPDAEIARIARQQRGQSNPRDVEKQHCLVGWFGTGGAEQVILLCRAEYPNRNSLFEVRQALIWAGQRGNEGADAAPAKPARVAARPASKGGGGIKPPLD